MRTAIDTNVLLSVLVGTDSDRHRAHQAVFNAAKAGIISTSLVTYAELARTFRSTLELDAFLARLDCAVTHLDRAAAFQAGRFFEQYRARGGDKLRILADFLIAADALQNADRILTYDKRFFGTQFPGLTAITYQDL